MMHVMMFYYNVYTSQQSYQCHVSVPSLTSLAITVDALSTPFLSSDEGRNLKTENSWELIWQLECFNQPERPGLEPLPSLPPYPGYFPQVKLCKAVEQMVGSNWMGLKSQNE